MKCEEEFDEMAEFSRLEAAAFSGGVIHPVTQVFYKPICQYDDGRKLTKEAEKTTQEAVQEAKRIHRKYRKD